MNRQVLKSKENREGHAVERLQTPFVVFREYGIMRERSGTQTQIESRS